MINVFKPSLSLTDIFTVIRSLFSNNISGTSPVVSEFEKELSKKFNRKLKNNFLEIKPKKNEYELLITW